MPDFNTMELMVVVASRILENGATVGVGTGAPLAASMLAQKMHAPDLVIMFEAGGISPGHVQNADLGRRLALLQQGADGERHVRHHGKLPARNGRLHLSRAGRRSTCTVT